MRGLTLFTGVMAWDGVTRCFGETDRATGGWWEDHGERVKVLLRVMARPDSMHAENLDCQIERKISDVSNAPS